MYARLKKGNRLSEVYPLNGTAQQMMEDHNADEIHLVEKNGLYNTSGGGSKQKWRTKEIISSKPHTPSIPQPIMERQSTIPITTPGHPTNQQMMVSSIEAAQVQIMFLQQQLSEATSEKKRFQDKFEDYKSKFEKVDREIYELKQDHREEIRNMEKDHESGLNGIIDKNPELATKAMEIFGPLLVDKFSKPSNKQLAGSTSQELNDLINYLQEIDKTDKSLVNTCNMLCHLHSRESYFEETKAFINQKFEN